ncbi:farnesyl pyrophosphate synthase-like [Panicum miliaceum]|uniref:Farnesyl pyrophosphate synthase-like n=1 Tax=Panicum miliaceum TaxID=4540 RepID=A0A3L6R1K6_PANMI|nr:farnesyl pyrophosphate synthase-like [Panicum miliaceum]
MATAELVAASGSGGADSSSTAAFMETYGKLKKELLEDHASEFTDESSLQWIDRMMDYNVLGGKCNRGLSVVDSYKILKGVDVLGHEDAFLACTLGWCIEWLQAYILVHDDIMDNSQTRRGKPCWFRVPQVGLIAVNDGIILRSHISRILQRHFKGKPYYIDLIDLFNEAEFKVSLGQLDLITTHDDEKDLRKYNVANHRCISQYKASYYSCYLPVACALLVAGENLDNFGDVKNILFEIGIYYQIQIGTDIQEYKCSWLVVQALEHADENQKRILFENYGKSDPVCVAKVKDLYKELNLEEVFREYESESYNRLIVDIKAQPNKAVQNVLKSFLHKIYKRDK